MHRAIKRWTVGVALSVVSAGPVPANSDLPSYKDPNAPVEARLEDLLKRMSLEEKVAQMLSIWDAKTNVFDARLEFDPGKMARPPVFPKPSRSLRVGIRAAVVERPDRR